MKTSEIYHTTLAAVMEVTGIGHDELLHSNREENADARFLLVHALSRMLSDSETARHMGITRRGVSYIRSCDYKLSKWLVRRNWEEIRKRLDISLEGMGK